MSHRHWLQTWPRLLGALIGLGLLTSVPSPGQEAQPKAPAEAPASVVRTPTQPRQPQAQVPQRVLPADTTTPMSLDLPGRTLKFKATAGSIPLTADDGKVTAEIAYIAYSLDGGDPAKRPVTFLFNGGPGSSSAWLHIIGFGPWRFPIEGAPFSPSQPPALIANAETWLDFTDLVFIDPVGTGFSRFAQPQGGGEGGGAAGNGAGAGVGNRNQGGARYFYSVDGDAASVAETIVKWLRANDRLASPKMLVGESYGGIRAPKVAFRLQTQLGIGLNALVLISPVMDFGTYRGPRFRPFQFVQSLPTIAAAAREAKGTPFKARDEQLDVETYARGEYLQDLMRGPRNAAALDRIVKRVATYSGLPEAVVRQYGGRLDEFIYIREANRAAERQASGYDTTITGADPEPSAYFPRWEDPFSSALLAPITSSMLALYKRLGWAPDAPYHMLNYEVSRAWQYGNAATGIESLTQIENILALDPKLHLLVTHGATDLRTPYLGSVLLLEQLPAYADVPPGRVTFRLYPGGHMHYVREGSRKALREEVRTLFEAAVMR